MTETDEANSVGNSSTMRPTQREVFLAGALLETLSSIRMGAQFVASVHAAVADQPALASDVAAIFNHLLSMHQFLSHAVLDAHSAAQSGCAPDGDLSEWLVSTNEPQHPSPTIH